jgi:uncharacterized protein YecT (DUF1311 family)
VRAVVLVLAFCPTDAVGQEMVFDPGPTEACLAADTSNPAACIGHAADACMLENDGGETTVGMGFCLSQEWEWWDGRLNAAYGALRERHQANDAQSEADGFEAPPMAEALRDMQRAWIAYRDAACDYERAQWGGGSGGGPATAGCLMRLTGEQALALEGRLMMLESQ